MKKEFEKICSCLDESIKRSNDKLELETSSGTKFNLLKFPNGNYRVTFNTDLQSYESITLENLYKFLFENWRGNPTLGRDDSRMTLFEAIKLYIINHCSYHDKNLLKNQKITTSTTSQALNQILYGPPGTGKTYNTINKALEIIDGIVPENRTDAKQRFEELTQAGQIAFITFHQSYGYEEFVEGIKADLKSEEIKYKLEKGVFQKISNKAKENFINSQKADETLQEEKNIQEKMDAFLENALVEEIEFKKTQKNKTFTIKTLDEDDIIAYAEDSKYSDKTIILQKKEFYKILQSQKEFKTSRQLAKEVFGVENQRQRDTYYLSLYKEFQNLSGSLSEIKNLEKRPLQNYILIIDEINRGNISKIFGELITLIEPSKRIGASEEIRVRLPYSNDEFGVPSNLYILGTMNTADRSIALMDTALRRRFEFTEMLPRPELLDFKIEEIHIQSMLEKINQRVEYLYDRDHTIGHAYFMTLQEKQTISELENIFKNKIIPLLQEYFYDDWEKILMVLGDGFIDKHEMKSDIFDYASEDYLEDEKFIYTLKENFDFSKYKQ